MSSQRNPVYSQMVFSGNFLWISSMRFPVSFRFCQWSGSPPEKVTPEIQDGARASKSSSFAASSKGSPPFTSHVIGFWHP